MLVHELRVTVATEQHVYKHAISTIMPGQPLQMFETEESGS